MDEKILLSDDPISKKILETAMQIVKEEGYDNLKIRKVASLSGCSNSAIYTRFGDKDQLCMEIARIHAKPLHQMFQNIYRPDVDILTNLQRMARAEMEVFYAMDLDSVIMQMKYRGQHMENEFVFYIEEMLKNACQKGEIKVSNIKHTALTIETSFWGFVFFTKVNDTLNLEQICRMLDMNMKALISGCDLCQNPDDIWRELKEAGVDVDKALERLKGNKDAYREFLKEFFEEPDFQALEESIRKKDAKAAFEYAHGLKGMAANLGLEKIFYSISKLVEVLRANSLDGADAMYEEIKKACEEVSMIVYAY